MPPAGHVDGRDVVSVVSPTRTTFGARRDRAGGALAASLLVHAVAILIVYTLVTLAPPPSPVAPAERSTPNKELVWLVVEGPGGGGGGGGNRTPDPPARLQTRGPDALSAPILEPPPPVAPPRTPPRPAPPPDPPVVRLDLPVRPMNAGQMASLGAVDGSPLAPPASRGPGANGGAGTGQDGGSGPGRGPGLGPGGPRGTGDGAFVVGNGVTAPQLVHEVKPTYTTEAMRARIQGEVELSAIVRPDGSVTDLQVLRSLDGMFGLDEEAIRAARQWRFRPGTRFGQPVAVYVKIAVGFTMR